MTFSPPFSEISVEYTFGFKSAELVLGSPKCKATVTLSSSSKELDDMLSSFFSFLLLTSMAPKEDSRSSRLVGLRLRRGRACLGGGGGDGDGDGDKDWWW